MKVLHPFRYKEVLPKGPCILSDIQRIEICQKSISYTCVIEIYFPGRGYLIPQISAECLKPENDKGLLEKVKISDDGLSVNLQQ